MKIITKLLFTLALTLVGLGGAKAQEDPDLIEIPQENVETGFTAASVSAGDGYTLYTATGNLQFAIKTLNVDVSGCDYVVIKFAEPVPAGWCVAFWSDQSNEPVSEGSTEYKLVFSEDPHKEIGVNSNGILPQITLMTRPWGDDVGEITAKVIGIYKHRAPETNTNTNTTINHFIVYDNGIAGANNWDKQAVVTLNASLEAGTEYVLSAKVKVETATTEQIQPVPIFSTSDNKDTWGNSADVQYLEGRNVTTDFVEQVWYFTAAYPHDKVQFFMGKIGGKVYFDDVSIKIKDADTEFVDNGDFESPGISNWSNNWGGPSFTQDCDYPNADFVMIYENGTAGANNWDKQAVVTLNASLEAGTEYILSAKVKVETATTEQIQPVPIFSTSDNKDTWGNSADVQYLEGRNVTTDFVEQVWYFTAAYPHDKVQFFMGKIGGKVYFDDVSLKRNGDNTDFINNGSITEANTSNWGKNWGGPSFYRWDYSVSATIGTSRYATFSADKDINVDGVVTAYTAKYEGGKVLLTEVTEIPAGEGVIFMADAGTYTIPAVNSAAAITDNELEVSDGTVAGNGSIYALGKKNGVVGFYRVAGGETVPAGKAYLTISSTARDFYALGDETTGIVGNKREPITNNCYYDLQGRKVNGQLKKGLYIVNGKKVIIK